MNSTADSSSINEYVYSDETASAAESAVAAAITSGEYTDGVYTGSATGYRGTTEVQVTVTNGLIAGINVLSTDDDREYFNRVEGSIINGILQTQSTEVDTVTGATFSSNAIIGAVADALAITFENTNSSTTSRHGGS